MTTHWIDNWKPKIAPCFSLLAWLAAKTPKDRVETPALILRIDHFFVGLCSPVPYIRTNVGSMLVQCLRRQSNNDPTLAYVLFSRAVCVPLWGPDIYVLPAWWHLIPQGSKSPVCLFTTSTLWSLKDQQSWLCHDCYHGYVVWMLDHVHFSDRVTVTLHYYGINPLTAGADYTSFLFIFFNQLLNV